MILSPAPILSQGYGIVQAVEYSMELAISLHIAVFSRGQE